MEDGVEDDVEEFSGEAVEVGLEGGGGVGVGHGSLFFLFSFADVGSLGWWKFLFLHLFLHDRIIIHGNSKKLEMRRW